MTQENFAKLQSLQARSLGLLIAKILIKSFIKACEIFKRSKETFEKKIEQTIVSDAFKNVKFIGNHRYFLC